MDCKLITYENAHCWYELSWQEKPPAIVLRIHNDFIENKKKINLEKAPIVENLIKELNLPEFKGDFAKDIGFGGDP